jgi:osmotically-inducible protein OsmY
VAVIAVVALLACAGNINPSRQIDDAALATSVRDALRSDPALSGQKINVSARQGTVTMTGVVRNVSQRDRASAVARSVANVKTVNNLLAVE